MIRDATAIDIAYVVEHLRDDDRIELFGLMPSDDGDELVRLALAWNGRRWVCASDDAPHMPVAVGGVSSPRAGVWVAWAFGTDQFARHAREITEHCRGVVEQLEASGAVHRLEAVSWAGHTSAHRWLRRHLGFVQEATLRRYGRTGEDYIIFTRSPAGAPQQEG